MKFFIVEDDFNIVTLLKKIINDRNLGTVISHSLNSEKAKEDILILKPDIVLIDLLMPKKDGITLMKEIKEEDQNINFIMISQVQEKDMISKAYQNGVEYYISKPINAIEVENVIKKEIKQIEENKVINQINDLVDNTNLNVNLNNKKDHEQKIKKILNEIGILGESGSKDIINICSYLISSDNEIDDYTIKDICSKFNDSYKAVEQRIRRAALKGLRNLAHLGVEDYMNKTFQKYSNSLYDFKEIRNEMDYIREKNNKRGKVNFKKFIDNILFYSCS
ncbi:MAG TPA: response regulator [Halanaerobiales bacterium]|nr:response regulator [Halanaerobiales bacterium]